MKRFLVILSLLFFGTYVDAETSKRNWAGAKAITSLGKNLYITQKVDSKFDVRLYRVNPKTGEAKRVGGATYPNSLMTRLGNELYLINGVTKEMSLSEVNPKTGKWKNI